jgi:hypothetical protein
MQLHRPIRDRPLPLVENAPAPVRCPTKPASVSPTAQKPAGREYEHRKNKKLPPLPNSLQATYQRRHRKARRQQKKKNRRLHLLPKREEDRQCNRDLYRDTQIPERQTKPSLRFLFA